MAVGVGGASVRAKRSTRMCGAENGLYWREVALVWKSAGRRAWVRLGVGYSWDELAAMATAAASLFCVRVCD